MANREPIITAPGLSFSPEQIAQMEKEKAHWTAIRDDADRKLIALNHLLKGAASFRSEGPAEIPSVPKDEEIDPTNLMGTMVKIANESEKPLSKKELKAALITAGVNQERVKGPYFYVAINRLYDRNRITVFDDGTVWKASDILEANAS